VSKDAWFATGPSALISLTIRVTKTHLGHYARKSWVLDGGHFRPVLLRPLDKNKDQTYFLSAVPESSLARALFPLEGVTKPEVRKLAKEHGLTTADRPDSVGICFVGEKNKFHKFLGASSRHHKTMEN